MGKSSTDYLAFGAFLSNADTSSSCTDVEAIVLGGLATVIGDRESGRYMTVRARCSRASA
jgi:hypothetical protein